MNKSLILIFFKAVFALAAAYCVGYLTLYSCLKFGIIKEDSSHNIKLLLFSLSGLITFGCVLLLFYIRLRKQQKYTQTGAKRKHEG